MNKEMDQALERLVDQELRRLPDLPAPGALVHRVMLAVHRRETLPWYQRAWPTWPRPAQALSLVALIGLSVLVATALAQPQWIPGYTGWDGQIEAWKNSLGAVLTKGMVLVKGLIVVGRALGKELLLFGTVLAVVGYLSSVGLATACYRLARHRA